jgi:hypothetical protein
MMTTPAASRQMGLPHHLRSAFSGSGMVAADSPRARPSSPRPSSPRYLQHTAASAARTVAPGLVVVSSSCGNGAPLGDNKPAPSPSAAVAAVTEAPAMRAAGGSPHLQRASLLDFSSQQPRRLKRSISLPRSLMRGSVPQPAGDGATEEVARPKGKRTFNEVAAAAPAAANAAANAAATSAPPPLAACHDAVSALDMQVPASARSAATHDKSVPNVARSRRAPGVCQPEAVAVTPKALAAHPVVLLSDAGGAHNSAAMRRRGGHRPVSANPSFLAPAAGASPATTTGGAAAPGDAAGRGLGNRIVRGSVSPSRRARGACSPQRERGPAPFEWL